MIRIPDTSHDTQGRARRLRAVLARSWLAGWGLLALGGCDVVPPGERFLWASRAAPGYSAPPAPIGVGPTVAPDSFLSAAPVTSVHLGGLVRARGATWMVADWPDTAGAGAGKRALHVWRAGPGEYEWQEVFRCGGESPGLVKRGDGGWVLVYLEREALRSRAVVRRGSSDGRSWEEAVEIRRASAAADDSLVAVGTPVESADGTLFVPLVWWARGGEPDGEVTIHASSDGGTTWQERGTLALPGAGDAALVARASGPLLLVARAGSRLLRSESEDAGESWAAWNDLGMRSFPGRLALAEESAQDSRGGESARALGLAWTDPGPDTTVALPAMQALRFALSTDGGVNWEMQRPLEVRPGRVLLQPALQFDAQSVSAAFVEAISPGSPGRGGRIVCMGYERQRLADGARAAATEAAPYGVDPAAARAALRLLVAHTLARPPSPRRAFVEGYLMRGLVGAQAVFDSLPQENPEWFPARASGERARAWADLFLAAQDKYGYWPTGYGAAYIADMAAAAGLFPTLAPTAEPARVQQYEAAVRRFTAALHEDGMLLQSGAVGVGWPGSFVPRSPTRVSRQPYLVSTALAGIELQGWLYRRGGRVEDGERARRALDYTLTQVQADGSLVGTAQPGYAREGALVTAVYVQEGWMAADWLLGDPQVLARLRAALPLHVEWLLRIQHDDGGWDTGAEGEFARTPAIVNFLVWYDRRCEVRADVRAALQRAAMRCADPARWEATGLFRAGHHHEVERAMTMRALLALSRSQPVW